VVRKIRAAEGHPGVLDVIEGTEFYLFGVHHERALRARTGASSARTAATTRRATASSTSSAHRAPSHRQSPRPTCTHARPGTRCSEATGTSGPRRHEEPAAWRRRADQ
jgi:hypothetical protein